MRTSVYAIVSFCFALGCTDLHAQEANRQLDKRSDLLEEIAEPLLDEEEENPVSEQLYNDLEWLSTHPIDLNQATRTELEQLPFMDQAHIDSFLNYRDRTGELFSLYELQYIAGFTPEMARNLATFTQIIAKGEVLQDRWLHEINGRIQYNFEKAKGFKPDESGEKKYPGPAEKLLFRYKGSKGKRFRWGLTADNDPGEPLFTQSNRHGFDFYSCFFSYQGEKLLKELCVGDYQVKSGQGLTIWSGYGKRKSAQNIGIRQIGQGISPYCSADENRFLRGISTRLQEGPISLTLFYSNTKVDANISGYTTDSLVNSVSSLQTSGYHRTQQEVRHENSLGVQTSGASLRYTQQKISAGINCSSEGYDATVCPQETLYNHYAFRGKNKLNGSIDLLYVGPAYTLFGEAALCRSGGKAIVAGIEAYPASKFNFSLLYRNYDHDYHGIMGNGFADGTNTQNEEGTYLAFVAHPFPSVSFSGYADLYRSHWIRYLSNSPIRGVDTQVQCDVRFSGTMNMYFRYKSEMVSEKSSFSATIKSDVPKTTQRLRGHLNWKACPWLTCRFRTEFSAYRKDTVNNKGTLIQTDFQFFPESSRFSATCRVALFTTNGYQARIYSYENDMPQSFYIPAFYDRGIRSYLQVKWQASRLFTCYLKYGFTYYPDKEFTGSGDMQVEGKLRNELKMQLRIRL